MKVFRDFNEEEIERINKLQKETFNKLFYLFDPPLPEGVPERLEKIVAYGKIPKGGIVLDVGTGTGIIIPLIRKYKPSHIYACDLSGKMLQMVKQKYPEVETIKADVRELRVSDKVLDVTFLNACYPNIVDKKGAFCNLSRMLRKDGRIVISHPLGKDFILGLKKRVPFPLDEFPSRPDALSLFAPFGLEVETFIDEEKLYILVLRKKYDPCQVF